MTTRERGRPRRSSPQELEDAATELFLEQGFHNTTADDIATRAGISRATFFNYFPLKSDVLWVGVDAVLAQWRHAIDSGHRCGPALFALLAEVSPDRVPLIATHREAMGIHDELSLGAGTRLLQVHSILEAADVRSEDSWLVTAALVNASLEFANAPAPRAPLSESVREELERIRGVISRDTAEKLF